jgi:hypothetical protein
MGGKVTTALQVAALLTLIFYPEYVKVPVYLAGVAAVYAIIDYGMAGVRKMAPVSSKAAESA